MERGEVEVDAEPWQYLLPLGGANSPQLISLYSTNAPITVAQKCLKVYEKPRRKGNCDARKSAASPNNSVPTEAISALSQQWITCVQDL